MRATQLGVWVAVALVSAGCAAAVGLVSTGCAAEPGAPRSEAGADPARVIARQRSGLARITAAMDADAALFPARPLAGPRLLGPDQRAAALATWAEFADRVIALELLSLAHADFFERSGEERAAALALRRAAFHASYRFSMDFIERIERDPGLARLLDEAHVAPGAPELGYDRLKLRYLHVARASEFAALEALAAAWGESGDPALLADSAADAAAIWRRGAYSGPRLTAANGLEIVRSAAASLWLPVQEDVARWMGEVRVRRHGEALISAEQVDTMIEALEPGDVLLQRREWYLTNAGIPGFWTHAALYVGTPEERSAVFGDPALEDALRAANPDSYPRALAPVDGLAPRVLEAIAEGVVFTPLEASAHADSIAVLRPRLGLEARAAALRRAFGFAGRPYDYDFDFLTDAALVCSELVYKAYQPETERAGLRLPLETVAGRLMMAPNELARLYQRERGLARRQFDFVLMLDGDEGARRAHPADAETFAASWRRPKWHIVTSRTAPAAAEGGPLQP